MRLVPRLGLAAIITTCLAFSARPADPVQLLQDFVHYSLTANVELAQASGDALLDSGVSDQELAEIVDDDPALRDRLIRAYRWGREVPALEQVSGQIEKRVEMGRLEQARDEGRIEEAIPMLGGTRRERQLGARRLLAAGEHAVPAIVRAFNSPELPSAIRVEIIQLMPAIGREAVDPLTTALPHLPAPQQVVVTDALARIGYPHAQPALATLAQDDSAPSISRQAAADALGRLGSSSDVDLAALHTRQARRYLAEFEHLRAQPIPVRTVEGELVSKQNVWRWDPTTGLVTTTVPDRLYHPVMAARHAFAARALAPEDRDALAAFVAANLRLAHRMGEEDLSTVLPELDRSPAFYATVHGPDVARDVLALSMDQQDAELALDALDAMSRVSGSNDLLEGGDREPLLEALLFDDPRVRFEAAIVAASSMPKTGFPGSERVVPLLGRAALGGAGKLAAVIAAEDAARHRGVEALEQAGYRVVAVGNGLESTLPEGSSLDLLWIEMGPPHSNGAEHAAPLLESLGMPILLVMPQVDIDRAQGALSQVPDLTLMQQSASADAAGHVLADISEQSALTGAQRKIYAVRALSALRDLASVAPDGLHAGDALAPLSQLVQHGDGGQKLLAGEVLAAIDTAEAQRALINASLSPDAGEDRDRLLDLAASSVRLYGDHTTRRQRADLMELIKHASGAEAEAAARLQGSLASTASIASP
ncbi:MAG: hypothetical protein MK101_09410 [Phycisphaerales bacterium]|nr:hypothetical protein [Phycisphaerales bacterium]